MITEYYHPEYAGGTPMLLSQLTRFMKDQCPGFELDVVTSRNYYRTVGPPLSAYEDWDGIHIHRLSVPKSNRPSTLARLAAGGVFSLAASLRLVAARRYDLVVVGTNPPAAPICAQFVSALRRVPYVYLIHDLYPDLPIRQKLLSEAHPASRACRAMQRTWLRRAGRVLVLGRCSRDYLVDAYGLSAEKIDVMPNWGDHEKIQPKPVEESAFRAKNGLTGIVVLYAGNLGPMQGLNDFLDAAELLREERSVTFVLAGSGSGADMLRDRIRREQIRNVKILPPVTPEEYPDMLAGADISIVSLAKGADGLAVPSKFYNILASGRPSIAVVSPSSEVARVVREAECGIRVDQESPKQLADAVLVMKESVSLRESMGANAREVLLSKYTLPRIAKAYHEVFNMVIKHHGGRA